MGEKFTLAVRVQAGSQMVDGAQANLNFDSTYLKVVSIAPGSSLSVPIQNLHDNKAGTVDYAAGTFSNFPSGTFNLVLIEFEALQNIPDTQVSFNQLLPRQSDVTYGGVSVLGTTTPAVVHVIQVSRVYRPWS